MRAVDYSTYFQEFADQFMAGDYKSFGKRYIHPLVVYRHGDIRIEKTLSETLDTLSDRLASARMKGAVRVESTASEAGAVTNGRVPIRVIWRFLAADGTETARDEVRYFLRTTETGDVKIELLEVLSSTLTEIQIKTQYNRH